MAKYEVKPTTVEATQWFENGDHPGDDTENLNGNGGLFLSEGKVVRRYRTPDMDGQNKCEKCGDIMHRHGWIDNDDLFIKPCIVCPGDWVIISSWANEKGNLYYSLSPDDFNERFKEVEVKNED